jgi:hypothetical protein
VGHDGHGPGRSVEPKAGDWQKGLDTLDDPFFCGIHAQESGNTDDDPDAWGLADPFQEMGRIVGEDGGHHVNGELFAQEFQWTAIMAFLLITPPV